MRHQESLRSPMGIVETMKARTARLETIAGHYVASDLGRSLLIQQACNEVERRCRIGLVTING